jgi:D-alanyl-D-alanine carboxypeptidase
MRAVLIGVLAAIVTSVAALPATADAKRCGSGQFDRGGTCTTYSAAARKIDQLTRTVMAAEGARAAIVRVQVGKQTVVSRGYGNSMEGVPATPQMHFRPGAMVLPMLTTLLLQLQENHQLDLDDSVSKWFPTYPNAATVTLRMLASSTSGYWDYIQENDPFIKDFHAAVFRHWTDAELLRYAFPPDQPLACDPGACFHYAHTNFVVLGQVVQKVTGRSVASLMRSHFIRPLGLSETHISKLPAIPAPVLHAYTTDRGVYEDSTTWSPSWGVGKGMVMTSTARDMVKELRAIGSGRLLSKSSMKQLTAPLSFGLPGDPAALDYGLGINLSNGWVLQNPQFNGYIGLSAYLRARDITIVTENTNGPRVPDGRAISGVITRQIIQYLAPDQPLLGGSAAVTPTP